VRAKGACDICKRKDVRIEYRKNDLKYCQSCYRKEKQEKCSICNKIKRVDKRIDGNPLCPNCYIKSTPKQKCIKCNKLQHLRKGKCQSCYRKGKQEKCFSCKEVKRVEKRIDGNPICPKCSNKTRLKHECKKCGIMSIIHSKQLCFNCYKKCRMETDEQFKIKELVRKRIRNSIKSKHPKTKYREIIEFLGPCPGNIEDYHIDHIFPLSAFNLQKEFDIAFSPENHQWLLANDNLLKGSNYNLEELKIFKNKIMNKVKI